MAKITLRKKPATSPQRKPKYITEEVYNSIIPRCHVFYGGKLINDKYTLKNALALEKIIVNHITDPKSTLISDSLSNVSRSLPTTCSMAELSPNSFIQALFKPISKFFDASYLRSPEEDSVIMGAFNEILRDIPSTGKNKGGILKLLHHIDSDQFGVIIVNISSKQYEDYPIIAELFSGISPTISYRGNDEISSGMELDDDEYPSDRVTIDTYIFVNGCRVEAKPGLPIIYEADEDY